MEDKLQLIFKHGKELVANYSLTHNVIPRIGDHFVLKDRDWNEHLYVVRLVTWTWPNGSGYKPEIVIQVSPFCESVYLGPG